MRRKYETIRIGKESEDRIQESGDECSFYYNDGIYLF
jgi:hypothetical protein